MSTSPEQAPHEAALFRTIRGWGLTRGDHGVVGGVVEGLGERIGMARVPARIIMVVAALVLNGLILLAYGAAWALLPDRKGNIIVQNFGRGVPNVGALIGIAILTLFGLGDLDNRSNFFFETGSWSNDIPWSGPLTWGGGNGVFLAFAVLVPLVVLGAVITAIVLLVKKSNNRPPAGPGAVYAAPPAPDGPAATPESDAAAPAAAIPPARQWAPAPPAPPVPPSRPRVPGPGRAFYLLTLAWAAVTAASAVWLERNDRLAVHPTVAGFVIFATGLGIILVLISLAGRKLGFLGFVGIVSVLPLAIFAGNSFNLRHNYATTGGITGSWSYSDDGPAVEPSAPQAPIFDPTLAFDGLYSELLFNGDCYESDPPDFGSGSVQRLNLAAPAADALANQQIDITAQLTYISVPRGTSITLDGEANASATVVFPERGFQCEFWSDSQQYMHLTNTGSPTIDLVVRDDQFANTIVIQEATS